MQVHVPMRFSFTCPEFVPRSKVTHAPVLVGGSPTIGDLVSLPLSANVPPRELSRPPTRTGAQSNAFFEVNTGKLSPCCHSSVADPFHLNWSSQGKLQLTKSLPLQIERRSNFLFLKFCLSLKYGFVKLSLTWCWSFVDSFQIYDRNSILWCRVRLWYWPPT